MTDDDEQITRDFDVRGEINGSILFTDMRTGLGCRTVSPGAQGDVSVDQRNLWLLFWLSLEPVTILTTDL